MSAATHPHAQHGAAIREIDEASTRDSNNTFAKLAPADTSQPTGLGQLDSAHISHLHASASAIGVSGLARLTLVLVPAGIVLGIIGAALATFIGQSIGHYGPDQGAGFITANQNHEPPAATMSTASAWTWPLRRSLKPAGRDSIVARSRRRRTTSRS